MLQGSLGVITLANVTFWEPNCAQPKYPRIAGSQIGHQSVFLEAKTYAKVPSCLAKTLECPLDWLEYDKLTSMVAKM